MPSGIRYNHETVVLDGETFSDCEFRDSRLVYSGGEVPSFSRCKFDGCEWKLDDSAARTLTYLRQMWEVGAKAPVQSLIKDITTVPR